MLAYKHACGGPRMMSGIFLHHSTLLVERGASQSNPELSGKTGLNSQFVLGDPLSKPSETGIIDMLTCAPAIYVGAAILLCVW